MRLWQSCVSQVWTQTLLHVPPNTAFPVLRWWRGLLNQYRRGTGFQIPHCSTRSQSRHYNLSWGSAVFAFRCYVYLQIFSGRVSLWQKLMLVVVCRAGVRCRMMRLVLVLPHGWSKPDHSQAGKKPAPKCPTLCEAGMWQCWDTAQQEGN